MRAGDQKLMINLEWPNIPLVILHLKINSICRIVAGSLLAKEVMRSATRWRAISTAGSVTQPGSTSGTNSAATISKNPD